jgi:hypothetical protein
VLQLPGRWGHSVSSRSFHQLGLLYALIALLGGTYAAYDEVTAELERQRDVDYPSIFIPRLGFALIVAFVVYCIVRAVGSVVLRLHGIALAAQPARPFITPKSSAL